MEKSRRMVEYLKILVLLLFFVNTHLVYSQSNEVNLKYLIRPDFETEEYWEFAYRMKDTVTSTGWEIKYFVKNDDTRFKDVYILCQKDTVRKIHKIPNVLKYRTYFVPRFSYETAFYLYFEHGCATDCSAILTFSKRNQSFCDFPNLVKMDWKLDLLVRVTDYARKEERKLFELEIIDLARNKNHIISYENVCRGANNKIICVEEIKFFYDKIIIKTILSPPQNWEEEIKETKIIKL